MSVPFIILVAGTIKIGFMIDEGLKLYFAWFEILILNGLYRTVIVLLTNFFLKSKQNQYLSHVSEQKCLKMVVGAVMGEMYTSPMHLIDQ